MPVVLRPARIADAEAIAAIYAPYVRGTVITFEEDEPDAAEFAARLGAAEGRFPWLVAERDGTVAGYAYAYAYRARAAYRWVAETGLYVGDRHKRLGIGTALYEGLLDALEEWGFVAAIGAIALPNRPSVALHEKLGFEPVGVQPRIGFKRGQWCDVGFWQIDLAPRKSGQPEPKRPE